MIKSSDKFKCLYWRNKQFRGKHGEECSRPEMKGCTFPLCTKFTVKTKNNGLEDKKNDVREV